MAYRSDASKTYLDSEEFIVNSFSKDEMRLEQALHRWKQEQEITTKENEPGEIVIETASKPTVLTEEQKVVFTDLIKTNSPYLQDQISQVKTDFPEQFASVIPFSDS